MKLCAAHGRPPRRSVVFGAGKMVEAVGDIEREFRVDSVMIRTFLNRPFHIHNQIAGRAFFAGNRIATETDDIGRSVFAEKLAVILSDPLVVSQQKRHFFPEKVRIGGFQQFGELSGQLAKRRQVDSAFLPVYQCCFHLWGRRHVHEAYL